MSKDEPGMSLPRVDAREADRIERACIASGVGIYEFDVDRQHGVWSVGIAELLGRPSGGVDLDTIADALHPDDRQKSMAMMATAMRAPGHYDMEHRILRPDGRTIWVRDRGRIYVDGDGRNGEVRRAIGTLIDTTAEVDARERLDTIAGEMQHRSRNLLTVVTSLVRLMRTAPGEDFRAELIGRLRNLATSLNLSDVATGRVDIGTLCRSQLASVWDGASPRLAMSGDDLDLRAEAAEPIGMALYELLTNAMKYGALSNDDGRVAIAWSAVGDRFHLTWEERGGPPPASDAQPGFGTHIIRDFVAMSLDAQIEVETSPGGLVWRLDAPAGNALADQVTAS